MWKGEVLKTFLLRHRFDIVSIATVGDVACAALQSPFFLPEPVAFRRVYGLEAYSRTSRESNHHRQSVSAVKNDALPTEPRGHLCCIAIAALELGNGDS